MIYFILGFISGAVVMGFFGVIAYRKQEKVIQMAEKGFDSILEKFDSRKAEIIEPTPSDVEALEALAEENDKKGRDTLLSEL